MSLLSLLSPSKKHHKVTKLLFLSRVSMASGNNNQALDSDPWSIKKKLSSDDIKESRLFMLASLVYTHILPLWHIDNLEAINGGVGVGVWDCDTHSEHQVTFRNSSPKGYVFEGNWTTAFVNRRGLKKGNKIGLYWDSNNSRFNFCVLG